MLLVLCRVTSSRLGNALSLIPCAPQIKTILTHEVADVVHHHPRLVNVSICNLTRDVTHSACLEIYGLHLILRSVAPLELKRQVIELDVRVVGSDHFQDLRGRKNAFNAFIEAHFFQNL
jgi:hypothetical protein